MKKFWMIFLACILICVAGCKKNADSQAVETTAQVVGETESHSVITGENIPAPQTTCGTARVHNTPAVLSIRMRGNQVDVVGLYDENHYVIKTAEGYGLIRREFIRMEGEPAYKTWTGYAYGNAQFYTDLYLIGDPAQKLKTNTKVEVLEDLGYCYVVQIEQTVGFMKQDQISKWWINTGGGASGNGERNPPAGQDGGEISLYFNGSVQLLSAIVQTGEVTGTGTILADGTEVILGYFARGEEIPVVMEEGFSENKAGFCTVYLDGLYAWVNEKFVCMDAETYAQWDGYAQWSALVYDNYHLLGSPKDKLNTNTKVRVVEELENCYVVEIGEVPGFMEKDMVSKDRITYGGSNGGSTGNNSGNVGGNSGNTGNNSGSTGDNSGNTGGNSGSTGDNSGNTGNNSGNTGNNSGNTGNNSGNTGDNSGNTGDNSGSAGDNSGSAGDNSGSTGDNSGNTGDNSGNTGDNSGSTGDNSGSTGDNSGSTGDNSGNTGNNSGNTGGVDPEWTPPIM